jgi:hypothetical protein
LEGDKLTVVDRDNWDFDVVSNVENLPIDGVFILNAGAENVAVMHYDRGRLSATSTGGTKLGVADALNKAIAKLHTEDGDATGGVVSVFPTEATLEKTVYIDSSARDSVASLLLKGAGRQSSFLKASGFDGDAFKFRYPIYVNLEDFGVRNATLNGINLSSDGGHAGNRNTINRMHSGFNGENGYNLERSFMTSIYDSDTRSNGKNGFFWNNEVHTSWNVSTCYSLKNAEAGYRAEYMVYSKMQACGADENQHGYVLQGCRAFHIDACGAEANKRAGWWIQTVANGAIENYISMTATLSLNNDSQVAGWAAHTHVQTNNIIPSVVFSREPVSLKNTNGIESWDFIADGRFAMLALENPIMQNKGCLTKNEGYIQVNYSVPKIIYDINFAVNATKQLLKMSNQSGSNNTYSGDLLITVQNAAFGSGGNIGTATYKLLISKSVAGYQVIEVAKAGLVEGTSQSHPSFSFRINNDQLEASAISLTQGNFWFAIEKVAGNIVLG